MSKANSSPTHTPSDAGKRVIPPALLRAILLACRISGTRQGAPARCRRQICRKERRCRATLDKAGDLHCPGGLKAETTDEVFDMLLFLYLLGQKRPI
ncbi:hypothetical protein EET67_06970 [Pseudaminobacter arsenicus]|uniref:Uncharacterized protein n=1 Tax=Borborobacter arsenicus TaxID=1851146 RepID=A0A432V894_9HYPH|nr:hypothetical protein [Pseudaminobacter arsenicus]RUM98375.1 hypothetical protein EET67_06970 [Pseudaminobacter arsenicus]